ncbi:MAG: hypothetical protein IPJ85_14160 [Flavobacteriales bacterium]|nr:hypothetical protein [Flavobacteriales bacterium]
MLIRHQRLTDTYETVVPYAVEAYIRHKTGISSAEVYWTTDTTAGYSSVAMSAERAIHGMRLFLPNPQGA